MHSRWCGFVSTLLERRGEYMIMRVVHFVYVNFLIMSGLLVCVCGGNLWGWGLIRW